MKQEETLKYNKLCAEFLGWEKCDTVYRTVEYYNNEKVVGSATHPAHMKFHSDWNWIMEVVEAIAKIPNKHKDGMYKYLVYLDLNPITGVTIEGMYSRNFEDKDDFQKRTFYEEDFKINVVQAVNQFLIWYNESKN